MGILKSLLRWKKFTARRGGTSFRRDSSAATCPAPERDFVRLHNLIHYANASDARYSASDFDYGYHQMNLKGRTLPGRRDPSKRLSLLPVNLVGKSVLDIGCNQGALLFSLESTISWGVGIDFDERMVNLCNLQRGIRKSSNLDFYVFDVDSDVHEFILDLLPQERVDIVFLLSVCMWVKKWRELIDFCSEISGSVFFESNGSPAQQSEQVKYLRRQFSEIKLLAEESEDDPKQKNRKLYYASKK